MSRADRIEALYLAFSPALRRSIPPRVKSAMRAWLLPEWRRAGGPRGVGRVRAIENRLWGGFSRSALADLEALTASEEATPAIRAQAHWTLARWHAAQGAYAAALDSIVLAREANPSGIAEKRQFLPEAKYLCLLGRPAEARALLDARTADAPFDSSVELMRASSHAVEGDETRALAAINGVFGRYGLIPIGKRDGARPLSIDNLAAAAAPPRPDTRARVSVIVPAFNCEATLGTALASLAEQSWADIEVLIVDDRSEDATPDVASDFCARDPRFRLIRQAVNGGSYPCRNRALAEATGEYITIHDADDWSHPEKIRLQADNMARGAPCNFTAWARTLPHLMFLGTVQATRTVVSLNFSSHMIRRDALLAMGGWDHVRVSGDTELIWRAEALAGRGRDAFRDRLLLPACPLSFGRLSPSSLTGSGGTHVLSVHHGVRREYREGADHWHGKLRGGEGRGALAEIGATRFPAPATIRPERPEPPPLDLLMLADFNMLGGTHASAMAMLSAGLRAGLACGILQYRRYDLDVTRPLDPATRQFAWDHGLRILTPGESARAATVILSHPPLASHVMDRFPAIDHDRLVVVVNQMAERDLGGQSVAYDPAQVRSNLREMLGSEGVWAPISERVRRLMEADSRYPAPHGDTWTPLIDVGAWAGGAPCWRGGTRARPVLGRHGRDHPLKWPADAAALAAAYCARRPCEVRFLGGAQFARQRLRRWPRNWRETPYGAQDVKAFLRDLDVFLHFPDRDYIEEFGRAPMEAMAAGVPVILPPEFEPTFGAAALYCEPEEVWARVEALWRDEAAWTARAEAGRAFVRAECGMEAFAPRLARLQAAAPARAARGG